MKTFLIVFFGWLVLLGGLFALRSSLNQVCRMNPVACQSTR